MNQLGMPLMLISGLNSPGDVQSQMIRGGMGALDVGGTIKKAAPWIVGAALVWYGVRKMKSGRSKPMSGLGACHACMRKMGL